MPESVNTIIVGAGQAGLSVSTYLTKAGREHLVLERGEIAETWRSQRWESFTVNSPNWMNQLPGDESYLAKPNDFWHLDELIESFTSHAKAKKLPVRSGTAVTSVSPGSRRNTFDIQTERGLFNAKNVVVASGIMQTPRTPAISEELPSWINQIHTAEYRNSSQLKPGGILIVGSAQSGVQIAEELIEEGKQVYLCTSKVGRSPRFYRGKDVLYWNVKSGFMDVVPKDLEDPNMEFAAQPQVSGTRGGHAVSLQQLAREGVIILGGMKGATGDVVTLEDNLLENYEQADAASTSLKTRVDEYIENNGIEAPPAERDPVEDPNPDIFASHKESIDLVKEGINTVIWCTGFTADFSWIKGLELTERGRPAHRDGISAIPGLYFIGFPWLRNRASGLIYGAVRDARHIASAIS
jgi:putative flavoprotein involved in K+ transport